MADEPRAAWPGAGTAPSTDLCPTMFRNGSTVEEADGVMYKRYEEHWIKFRFTEVDGKALYQGDIVLTDDLQAIRSGTVPHGIGSNKEMARWPNGIVHFVTTDALRTLVKAAIDHWQAATPLCFQEDVAEDYISFEDQGGCWSQVGRVGKKQVISLGQGCGLGSAIHEIGHSLGLWHEQSRKDRDDFVTVLLANVAPQARHNFDQHILDATDLGAYDYGSIMHYPPKAFSINGEDTIVTKSGASIGQRNGLSAGDIAAVRLMYPDLAWT
jgi:Astacin (Peptidase family M12A)